MKKVAGAIAPDGGVKHYVASFLIADHHAHAKRSKESW